MPDVMLTTPNNLLQWMRVYCLYHEAFPAAERKPFGIIVRMHREGRSDVWCVEKSGRFSGFASTINGDKLILLDYFAVERNCRGKGIGSAALAQLQRVYGDKGLFVEIESTREAGPDQTRREKRKRFYQACGMEELHVEADVFGVKMELLGSRCVLDFEGYRVFYRDHYGAWAAKNIRSVQSRKKDENNRI
ncbi:MAG: GNAT family N-acetyltransferase [Oscillospiraceae bacterium]|nr:GNAT family N-acetyltransferase [Oscillospiraceae bacterium]